MGAHFTRPSEPLEAIHATDPEFKETIELWFSQMGENVEDFLDVVASQPHAPWVVRSQDGANIGIVAPENFAGKFEDVADTDVLNDIYRERMGHAEKGYTWAHDDVRPTSHLVSEALRYLNPLVAPGNVLPDQAKRDDLVTAGSLIVAAIDKIDRANQTPRAPSAG